MARLIPTSLTDEEVQEFQELWYQEFKEHISKEYAVKTGLQIVRLVIAMWENYPMHKEKTKPDSVL